MSRPASFALGVAAAGVGYIYLRDRFWSRPTAVSTGLRRAQEELPGSHPIPLVTTPPLQYPADARLLLKSGVATSLALWNGGIAMAHGAAYGLLQRRSSGETASPDQPSPDTMSTSQ